MLNPSSRMLRLLTLLTALAFLGDCGCRAQAQGGTRRAAGHGVIYARRNGDLRLYAYG